MFTVKKAGKGKAGDTSLSKDKVSGARQSLVLVSAVCQVTFLSTQCAELHGIEMGQPGDLVCPPPQTRLGTASSRVPA